MVEVEEEEEGFLFLGADNKGAGGGGEGDELIAAAGCQAGCFVALLVAELSL